MKRYALRAARDVTIDGAAYREGDVVAVIETAVPFGSILGAGRCGHLDAVALDRQTSASAAAAGPPTSNPAPAETPPPADKPKPPPADKPKAAKAPRGGKPGG